MKIKKQKMEIKQMKNNKIFNLIYMRYTGQAMIK